MAHLLILDGVSSALSRQRGAVGAQAGHSIYWLAHSLAETESLPLAGGARLISGRVSGALARPAMLIEPVQLGALLRHWRIELVHAHYGFQSLLPLALPRRLPLVVTIMGGDVLPDQYYRGRFRPPLTNALLERANAITVKSDFLERAVLRINPAWQPKIERITWGIDTDSFRPDLPTGDLRAHLNLPAGALIFFDLRLAQPFYRKHIIMQAFARLPRTLPAVLVVSEYRAEPAYLSHLHELAQASGVADRVRFVGGISHEHMPLYLALADIAVAIPPSDGMPQSLYESMACGAYPIMGDLPQYAEVLQNGVNGTLIPLTDDDNAQIETLAAAMQAAAENPTMREAVAQQNRAQIVALADRKAETAKMNTIYARLLDAAPPR